MKIITVVLVVVMMIFIVGRMVGQNLVGNGSFEDYSSCPTLVGQNTNAIGWMSFRQSPDSRDHGCCVFNPRFR
ncbi:MAG TPA: hypothetical protein VE978_03635 [Chitinophagales bacterium]|nr:hypothetical protein [Chitinophagales bacterium]